MADHRGVDERRLAMGAVRALAVLAVPVAAVGGLVAGWPGAVSALVGLGFVLVLFGASAVLLAWVARRNPTRGLRGVGVLVGGGVVRLALYGAALVGLAQLGWVHRPSLAVATAAAIAVTLAYELRLMAGMPRLFWIDPDLAPPTQGDLDGPRPTAVSNPTRSQAL